MTVLPDLERQLVEAAAAASGAPVRARAIRLGRGRSVRRRLALALSVVPVLVVAALILSTRGEDHVATTGSNGMSPAVAALRKAAAAAGAGTSAPVLRPNQAWHTTSVLGMTYRRGARGSSPPSLKRATAEVEKWIGANGMEDDEYVAGATGAGYDGVGTPASPPAFGDWDPSAPDGGPVQDFPTSAAAVPAYLRHHLSGNWHYLRDDEPVPDHDHSPFTQLAQLTAFLGDWPLRPASRAAAFEAIAQLPGLRYLGPATDALRHRGIAVAEDGVALPAVQLPDGSTPREDYRFTLIFDPKAGRVLGARTTVLSALPAIGERPGQTLFSWTYQPGLPQAGEVTPYTPAMKQQAAREQALENLRKPGHVCYREKTLLSGVNANSPAAIKCRKATQRITLQPPGKAEAGRAARKPADSAGRIR